MVAVDQREALRGMFAAHQSTPVPDSQLTQFKVDVARELSPYASALLVDQEFGIDEIIKQKALKGSCGLIAAADLLVGPAGGAATDTAIDTEVDPIRMRDIGSVGLKFLILPVSYSDSFEFEHVPGILDPGLSSEINLQLRWYVTNGVHTIKAGTPVAQIIPLSEKTYQMVCRNATAWDNLWVTKRRFLNNFSFSVQRKKLKDAYEAHFK
jgi:hypothetical protein